MRRAINYQRWSSDGQEGNSSKFRQSTFCLRVAKELQLDYVDIITDKGISAKNGLNLQMGIKEVSKLLQDGEFLIIENWDRFSRMGFLPSLDALRPIIDKGVSVIIGTSGGKYLNLNKDTIKDSYMQACMVQESNKALDNNIDRGMKLKASWEEKYSLLSDGKPVALNSLPSWLRNSRNPYNGQCLKADENPKYVMIVDRVRLVQRIFNEYGNSTISIRGLCRKLNSEKIENILRGKYLKIFSINRKNNLKPHHLTWNINNIRTILHNVKVLGICPIMENNAKIFPQIVTDELWQKVQDKIKHNSLDRKGRPYIHHTNLLLGIATCETCGGSLHRHIMEGLAPNFTQYPSLQCGFGRYNKCTCMSISESKVECVLRQILMDTDVIKSILEAKFDESKEIDMLPILESEMISLRSARSSLYEVVAINGKDMDIMSKLDIINQSIKDKQIEIDRQKLKHLDRMEIEKNLNIFSEKDVDWSNEDFRIRLKLVLHQIIEYLIVDLRERGIKTFRLKFTNVNPELTCKLGYSKYYINEKEFGYDNTVHIDKRFFTTEKDRIRNKKKYYRKYYDKKKAQKQLAKTGVSNESITNIPNI